MRMKTQQTNDKRFGDFYSYFADGKIEIKGFYKDDIKEGVWKKYDTKGALIKEMKFVNGKLENEEAFDREFTKELEAAEKDKGKFKDPELEQSNGTGAGAGGGE